jgi:hypothetical protein
MLDKKDENGELLDFLVFEEVLDQVSLIYVLKTEVEKQMNEEKTDD